MNLQVEETIDRREIQPVGLHDGPWRRRLPQVSGQTSVADPDPPGSTTFCRIRIHLVPRFGSSPGSTSVSFPGFVFGNIEKLA